ncbi:hypothetical protein ACLOJK_004813 [Asimina triloba]
MAGQSRQHNLIFIPTNDRVGCSGSGQRNSLAVSIGQQPRSIKLGSPIAQTTSSSKGISGAIKPSVATNHTRPQATQAEFEADKNSNSSLSFH